MSEVLIVKEVRLHNPTTNHLAMGVVRSNCYAKSFEFVKQLADIAKSDFPGLEDKDINVVHYGGQHYARTFGVEFVLPGELAKAATPPEGYVVINRLELTL